MARLCGQKEVLSHATIICKLVYNRFLTLVAAFDLPTHHITNGVITQSLNFVHLCGLSYIRSLFILYIIFHKCACLMVKVTVIFTLLQCYSCFL